MKGHVLIRESCCEQSVSDKLRLRWLSCWEKEEEEKSSQACAVLVDYWHTNLLLHWDWHLAHQETDFEFKKVWGLINVFLPLKQESRQSVGQHKLNWIGNVLSVWQKAIYQTAFLSSPWVEARGNLSLDIGRSWSGQVEEKCSALGDYVRIARITIKSIWKTT